MQGQEEADESRADEDCFSVSAALALVRPY